MKTISLGTVAGIAVWVATTAGAQSVLHVMHGETDYDNLGQSVAGAGDVNGDGFADFIVGVHLDDNNGNSSGSARVMSGRTGSLIWIFNGDSVGDQFGWSVDGAGDANGDGHADLIVGARNDDPNGSNSGMARVFSGQDNSILYSFAGDSGGDTFGWSVAGAGDVDADGFSDLIVGANGDDNNGSKSGSARVLSGLTGSVLYTFSGDSAGDEFGYSVDGLGDVNGDGFGDVVAGAPDDDNLLSNSGSIRVHSGFDGSVLYMIDGDVPTQTKGDQFGFAVAGTGDVNGDGVPDLVVGAPYDDNNGDASGSAWVLSGVNGAALFVFDGDSSGDHFGRAVGGAGDVDGDGLADFVVGAKYDSIGGLNNGSARVISALGSELFTLTGPTDFDNLGHSVSGAGDTNGDGFDDVIVAAHLAGETGTNTGSAWVHSGAGHVATSGWGCNGFTASWLHTPQLPSGDFTFVCRSETDISFYGFTINIAFKPPLGGPLDLTIIGAPGCTLWANFPGSWLFPGNPVSTTQAETIVPLPVDPWLDGAGPFLAQWLIIHPFAGFNSLKASLSDQVLFTLHL